MTRPSGERLVVLESSGPTHARTNPYISLLLDSLAPHVVVRRFSWSAALRGDYDVFHLHWPEVKVRGRTPARSVLRGLCFTVVLVRIRVGRRALVRTLHEVDPHEPVTAAQQLVLRLCDRWTTVWITLSESARPPTDAPSVRSPIGEFRTWFGNTRPDEVVAGRVTFFGLVRRYKGVARLLDAFSEVPGRASTLRIVGPVIDERLRGELIGAARRDPRVTLVDRYVSDAELRTEVAESGLVVLPFEHVMNSSSVLVALSLDRPVLAPDTPALRDLSDEVGSGWIRLYPPPLTASVLSSAIAKAGEGRPAVAPDLSARDWQVIARQHHDAFCLAVERTQRS